MKNLNLYKKKHIVVNAMQLTEENTDAVCKWLEELGCKIFAKMGKGNIRFFDATATINDWIVIEDKPEWLSIFQGDTAFYNHFEKIKELK